MPWAAPPARCPSPAALALHSTMLHCFSGSETEKTLVLSTSYFDVSHQTEPGQAGCLSLSLTTRVSLHLPS